MSIFWEGNFLRQSFFFFKLEDRTHSITPGGEAFRLAVKYVLPSLLEIPVIHFFRYVEFTNVSFFLILKI